MKNERMKFSLFLNSRDRPIHLFSLFQSIIEHTNNIEDIEILVGVDDDDETTLNLKSAYESQYPCRFVIGQQPNNLHTSINNLASQAAGDYLFVLNDDVVFCTPDWDAKILNQIDEDLYQEVWYLGIPDTSMDKDRHQAYASFPILTKTAYNILGYFMSETLAGLGGDVHLFRVFEAIGRIKRINEVLLDHTLHNELMKVLRPDSVARRVRQLTKVDCWEVNITKEVKALNEKIACSL